jgi:hypothetical protein
MSTKTKKPKPKPRPASKAKSKRRSVALLAATATARKSQPIGEKATYASVASVAALNPAAAMFDFIKRVTSVYAELPSRLIQCRSIMEVWREQARFAQRILSVTEVLGSRRQPGGESQRPRRFQQE